MGLQLQCNGCGETVLGATQALRKVNGRYLCVECVSNPNREMRYYCNSCHQYTPTGKKRGNGWIELLLYFFYILPGLIYSVWRRSGQPTRCPLCNRDALIPASLGPSVAKPPRRDEVDCPFCAERILAKASVCKHCGKTVRVGVKDVSDTVPGALT